MANDKMQVHCPNPHILGTFVREIPKECLIPKHSGAGRVLQVAYWIADKYHAVPPETKQLVAESACRAVGGPFASVCLSILKKY